MRIICKKVPRSCAFSCVLLLISPLVALPDACNTTASLNNFTTVELTNTGLNPNIQQVYNLAAATGGFNVFIVMPGQGAVYSYQLSTACAGETIRRSGIADRCVVHCDKSPWRVERFGDRRFQWRRQCRCLVC